MDKKIKLLHLLIYIYVTLYDSISIAHIMTTNYIWHISNQLYEIHNKDQRTGKELTILIQ